jgi:hypothetical protein
MGKWATLFAVDVPFLLFKPFEQIPKLLRSYQMSEEVEI